MSDFKITYASMLNPPEEAIKNEASEVERK
jgi:hypothetical protein